MGFLNPLSGPITVAGGTLDSVTAVLDPVTAGGGSVDTVANPVTAGGGHVDNVTNPVTAGGGTVANVTNPVTAGGGSVDTVANPVTPDPSSTIATVSTFVPFPFRDGAFWPCVSGESFAPVFTSGASYLSGGNGSLPCVQIPGTTPSAKATWPQLPRQSFSGKKDLKVSGLLAISATSASGGTTNKFGINPSSGSPFTRCAYFQFSMPVGTTIQVDFVYRDATTTHTLSNVASISTVSSPPASTWISWSIELNSAGDLTAIFNGVTVASVPGVWPYNAADVTPSLVGANQAGSTSPSLIVAIPQAVWS